ncbi:ABC transporter ATP-binding protein [Janthinobacterium fluminis]|uniref:ATP-binding cassette domain-containing protein n=1 Tax=Janthinobacterium fluminis TaxID=2987524 RepID=A0ABT5JYW5_9BURK|nr:ATP-binding cassette domain-containing protein [Janthinobacterium fluminis]MDC8757914.1 ATP-binding cassette domain-containing protein [Janthinobacterium fluminis]
MKKLTVRGLSHHFALTEVLAGVDLDLFPGESVALVGPSGCGKTTLLNLVAGLLPHGAGRIANGYTSVGCVFQQARLLPWKNARDNIALGLKARGVDAAARARRADALGLQLGLDGDDLDKYPHALSGGMQSRVALARALALEPDLLLLDEAFAALDVGLKAELYALLLAQLGAGGCAVLMITHDLMEAVRLADRILMMAPAPGRIVREFRLDRPKPARDDAWVYRTTGELMQAPEVRAGFGLAPAAGGMRCA